MNASPAYGRLAFVVARCVAAAFAFYATAKHPYSFYTLTRWVLFLTCCWGLFLCHCRFWPSVAPAYVLVGIVFNPLIPFHFTRGTWHNLDIAAGVLLVLVLIWHRLPPTAGEISAAKTSEAKRAIRLKRPAIALTDTIDVNVENSTLDVNVENAGFDANVTNPELEVNVSNTLPVPVTIERR